MMLRDIGKSENGWIDSTDSRVGVLASEISNISSPAFLLNDIDPEFPNRLYSMKILTLPVAGKLYLDKGGSGSFSNAPSGTYNGTQLIEKFDPGVGLVSSVVGSYSITVAANNEPIQPVVTSVVISPRNNLTGSQQFTAVVQGTDNPSQAVIWSKDGPGTLSADGNFVAPSRLNTVQVVSIKAESMLDPTKFDTVTVIIPALVIVEIPPEVTGVTVTPAGLLLLGGSSKQFSAVVSGTGAVSQEVVWSIDKGSISVTGVALMPDAIHGVQLVTITATSKQDPTKKHSVTATVQALGEIDPQSIVLTPARILRTAADNWKVREDYSHTDGDTFYLSQGQWVIDKDADDVLYYALDIVPYLQTINAGIANVIGLAEGVEVQMGPFVRNSLIIVKVGGGDRSYSVDAVNSVTFRITCSNGESFDRTIFFSLREN